MRTTVLRSYGSWKSPITGQSLVQSSLQLGQIQVSSDSIYWTEGRPEEKGRTALMSWSAANGTLEMSTADWDVRTRAHEYGGGAFLVAAGRRFFIQNSDQQIYEDLGEGRCLAITDMPNKRFADLYLDDARNRLICVLEDHAISDQVVNSIVSIDLEDDDQLQTLASGHDFYSNPSISPDGKSLSFLCWDHPNMPWDGTWLCLADISEDGELTNTKILCGGLEISVFQPQWDPNGDLYYVSDESGWWYLYRYSSGTHHCLFAREAEFGLPQWVFGMSTYTVMRSGILVAAYKEKGHYSLVTIDVPQGQIDHISTGYTDLDQIRGAGDLLGFIGGSVDKPSEIVTYKLSDGSLTVIQRSADFDLDASITSHPEPLSFGSELEGLSFAWYYAPKNAEFEAPENERPPLIVLSHGGPTAFSSASFSLAIQYWTSRGFAILDVNYSGSTGYGREYRKRLNANWGIRDVEDCCTAAEQMVALGLADPARLIIKGGSAGGYTTLAALTFKDVFKAGASYYGVGDLEMLARDTHKFESRYMDRLVGKYPQEKTLYENRSPLNHTDRLNCPVIFLQGLDDPVVPPNQAERMVSALKGKGIPVAYIPFSGESHGFRQASTITRAIESEYSFYCQIFGMENSDEFDAIEILNL